MVINYPDPAAEGGGYAFGGAAAAAVEVHKVCLPPPRNTVEKLRRRLADIFFPDGPLHGFKDQTLFRKLVIRLQFIFPIFQCGLDYSFELLKSDVVSGGCNCESPNSTCI